MKSFQQILGFELTYWLKNPLPYFFSVVLFGITFLTMWGMSAEANTKGSIKMMNSFYQLNNLSGTLSLILVFLLPAIIGNSIFRDFKSRMHTFLYTYPLNKLDYLTAKFGSAFAIVSLIVLIMVSGLLAGTLMPGVKEEVLLPFDVTNYLQLIFVFLLPNMLFFSFFVILIVIYTRNIYISFIGIILIIMFKSLANGVLGANGLETLAALLDPMGESAVKYTVQYWSLEERNQLALPITGIILTNRILWITISGLLALWCVKVFSFSQSASDKKGVIAKEIKADIPIQKVVHLSVPHTDQKFNFSNQLKTSWYLSTTDYRSIVISWPFLAILLAGITLVLFQQHQMNPQDGVVLVPTTANMLRIPIFIFSGTINLLTFLYAGVLMFRGRLTRMDGIIDATPQPDWVILLSRLLAIVKMQLLLLSLVFIAGITAQILSGYYRFEIGHYLFELFILQSIHFLVWACLAISVHSVFNNMYIGYFILLLIPLSIIFLPGIANYLDIALLKENILQFNTVKGQFIGFDYSEFNGYGSQLTTYFAYKIYWLIGGFVLILIAMYTWKRGMTFSSIERWQLAIARHKGVLKISLILGIAVFVGMGWTIYHQEHHVSKVHFSDTYQNEIMVQNEIRYGHLLNLPQPKLSDVSMSMDIFPEAGNFEASGIMTFTNKMNLLIDTIIIAKSYKEKTNCLILEPHRTISTDDELHYEIILLDNPIDVDDKIRLEFDIQNYPNSFWHHNSRVISDGTYIQSHILPTLGIRNVFLTNNKKRRENGLEPRDSDEFLPYDTTLLGYKYTNNDMGRITYECTLSTHEDQTAFTMGNLIRTWTDEDRNYYQYKSDDPTVNSMSWISGEYSKAMSYRGDVQIQLYRHPLHERNDDHFINGVAASIDYCSNLFGSLNHDTLKLIEFPITQGTYATLSGNLIPISESYFQCDVHARDNKYFNIPFFVSAHEAAHYWWGHRVDPANVVGGRFITEGMADYLAMKVVEEKYGKDKVLELRKKYHDLYLEERADKGNESPLILSSLENEYLNYRKASLSLYSLSEYLGDKLFNEIISSYEEEKRFTVPPFPTSLDFVDHFNSHTPDSLQYLIHDFFETITFYDKSIISVDVIELDQNGYDIQLNLQVSKYKCDEQGKRILDGNTIEDGSLKSITLEDYVDIGIYDAENNIVELRRVRITEIKSELHFNLEFQPGKIVIDPNYLLFDVNRDDDVWDIN